MGGDTTVSVLMLRIGKSHINGPAVWNLCGNGVSSDVQSNAALDITLMHTCEA